MKKTTQTKRWTCLGVAFLVFFCIVLLLMLTQKRVYTTNMSPWVEMSGFNVAALHLSVLVTELTMTIRAVLLVGLIGLLAAILSHGKTTHYFALYIVAACITYAVVHLLKIVFMIDRPTSLVYEVVGYSFPSGHAAVSAAAGAMLYVAQASVSVAEKYRRWLRGLLCAAAICVPLIVGMSRLVINVHRPFDVFAGWALGAGITFIVIVLGEQYVHRI